MKKVAALERIEVEAMTFSAGDTFNVDDSVAQSLIESGKAELVPEVIANDITTEDGTIDRSAFEAGMRRVEKVTGESSGLDDHEDDKGTDKDKDKTKSASTSKGSGKP